MVEVINHKHRYTMVMRNVPEARRVINRRLPEYEDYENNLIAHVLDLDNNLIEPPEPETFSILVNDQVVWTNKHLF